MYTKKEVARLLADERTRCVYLCNQREEKLRRQLSGARIGTRESLARAGRIVSELFFDLLGANKMDKERDFGEQMVDLIERDYFSMLPPMDKKPLDAKVYPSDEQTISVVEDETYGGAHCYIIRECLGFADGKTQYTDTEQVVQFVQKNDDGSIVPGLQSEQLVLALLDRHEKLNARFPSEQNAKMLAGLRMFLEACEERVRSRMERGVMGELKK